MILPHSLPEMQERKSDAELFYLSEDNIPDTGNSNCTMESLSFMAIFVYNGMHDEMNPLSEGS